MSFVSPVLRVPRRCVWPRALVLVLALLLPTAHAAQAGTVAAAGERPVAAAEYDVLDSAARTSVRRAAVPRRPAPRAGVPVPPAAGRPVAPPTPPAYAPRALRSVVLRC